MGVVRIFICPVCKEKVFVEFDEKIKEGVTEWPIKYEYTHKDHRLLLYLDSRLYIAKVKVLQG